MLILSCPFSLVLTKYGNCFSLNLTFLMVHLKILDMVFELVSIYWYSLSPDGFFEVDNVNMGL